MTLNRDRIALDLKRLLEGEVKFDDATRAVYSRAACIYSIVPAGVVLPKNSNDISLLVQYALERGISLTARGAGSGLAGQTINNGIIVDCSKYMTSVILSDDRRTVRVQPGVVQAKLNNFLKKEGLFFPPNPSSSDYCTLGGMTANNSSGPHSVKYGVTSDYLKSLTFVDYCGKSITVGKTEKQLFSELVQISEKYKNNFNTYPDVVKNSSGYNLKVLKECPENIAPFFCGTEGTLGIFTELVFKVMPLPQTRKIGLIYFDCLEKAAEAVGILRQFNPSALEILDETFINLLKKEKNIPYNIPEKGNAAVILEIDGKTGDVDERFGRAEKEIKLLTEKFIPANNEEDNQRLWKFRKQASPIINRLPGKKRSARFIEDPVIPPDNFLEFISRIKNLFKTHDVFAVIFGHAGDGNIHINPLLDLTDPSEVQLMKTLADEAHFIIQDCKGSLSGEHGDGRLRSGYLPWFYGELYPAFEEVKKLFDPENIFNPGIIAGEAEKQQINENLRHFNKKVHSSFSKRSSVQILNCHGCGACRTFCPVFSATLDESMSTRARMHLLQKGQDGQNTDILEKCSGCRRCTSLCPMMVEAFKASHEAISKKTMSLRNTLLSNPAISARITGYTPEIVKKLLKNQLVKSVNAKITGISERALSLFPEGGKLKDQNTLNNTEKEVIYFPGCYAKYLSPGEYGNPIIKILEKLGYKVHLPNFSCCGIPALANGNTELFEKSSKTNLDILSHYANKNIPVITGCPSCYAALKKDYPEYFPGKLSERISASVRDVTAFILDKLNPNSFKKQKPLKIVFHFPCHSAENEEAQTQLDILKLIPEIEIIELPRECCGMAGSYGLKKENEEIATKAGKSLFEIIQKEQPHFVATPCGMCRTQFQIHTGIKAVHPVKLVVKSIFTS